MTETDLGWLPIKSWKKGQQLVEFNSAYDADPTEIVLPPNRSFTIIINNPSAIACNFIFQTYDFISREDFIELIVKKYHELDTENMHILDNLYLSSFMIEGDTITIDAKYYID